MEQKPNAATPAPAATPANVPAVNTQPAAAAAPQTEGKVTITTKEYAELQRAKARSLSFDKRVQLNASRNNPARPANGNTDPAQQAVADAEDRASQAERQALQYQVRDSVRDLLAKPEYATLPSSTKDLILKNPAMLSEADNLEEALLDIEDFVIDQIGKIDSGDGIPVTVKTGDGTRPAPTSVDTPPTGASGAATPTGNEIEDTSKLTGPARSRAILRNSIRAKKSGAPQ
jgi:RNA polymerase-binding transcription factor DksA